MTRLANMFVNSGLTLFGSFVSGQIIHDDHACKFYDLKAVDRDLDYADRTCHPELSGRFLLPHDLDVLCTRDQFDQNMRSFEHFFFIRKVKKVDMTYMHWMCRSGEFFLYTTEFICIMEGEYTMIPVDFVVQTANEPLDLPNRVDSDVNGLLMTSSGLKIHRSVRNFYNGSDSGSDLTLLLKVIKNVLKRECLVRVSVEHEDGMYKLLPERRMLKLVAKGYAPRMKYVELGFVRAEDPYEGECIICLQQCAVPKCKLVKCDCNLRFCAECIIRSIDKVNTCPLCRKDIDTTHAKLDIEAWQKYGLFSERADYLKPV